MSGRSLNAPERFQIRPPLCGFPVQAARGATLANRLKFRLETAARVERLRARSNNWAEP